MDEISVACHLVGSRIAHIDGHDLIDVHWKDNTDEKYTCIRREIDARKLATWPHYGNLGAPQRTAKQQDCVEDLFEKQGFGAADNMMSACGVE